MKCWMFLLFAVLVPATSLAQVNALPSLPHLLVRGHADARYVPDQFTIKLQIAVVNKVPEQARVKVENYAQQILGQLEKCGALRAMTQASSMNITPETDYHNERPVVIGTKVSRTIEATFDDLEKTRHFIAALNANEEVQIAGTEVARSDIDAIRNQLRMHAIANSKQAAEQMAKAYGLNIKSIYSVSEVAPDFAYGIQAGSWDGGSMRGVTVTANALSDVDLRAGTIDVAQDIYAIYLTGN